MRIDLTRMVKLGLFFCLALTAWKGFMKLPEVYPALEPGRFYQGLVNDGENSLIMKERHFDFNYQTGKALDIRWREMRARGENPPDGDLVNRDRLERAIRKTAAKDSRNADYVDMAEEKLARARRLEAEGWSLGWSLCRPSAPREAGK
ncbi:hypothetical protein [Fundidesulfovibrio terrae]|uniref:hypothetical protein n=1 Tax=Fundidesulfovibrio terrae TaxID=2922866 RepID=UPI001FAFFB84|nr:hypothetical protein [Fundidesulfovibrio terrae]